MRVKFSSSIPEKYHAEMRELIDFATTGIATSRVDAHVKARTPLWQYRLPAGVNPNWPNGMRTEHRKKEYAEEMIKEYGGGRVFRGSRHFTGMAYRGVPSIANTSKTAEYLVTLKIPMPLEEQEYPRNWQYPGLKTAPVIKLYSWQEQFVHLVAHELFHIKEFRKGKSVSEVRAERWADKIVHRFRSNQI